jgi:hypothetical protein
MATTNINVRVDSDLKRSAAAEAEDDGTTVGLQDFKDALEEYSGIASASRRVR